MKLETIELKKILEDRINNLMGDHEDVITYATTSSHEGLKKRSKKHFRQSLKNTKKAWDAFESDVLKNVERAAKHEKDQTAKNVERAAKYERDRAAKNLVGKC